MQYMFLIYGDQVAEAAKPQAQVQAEMAEYFGLGEKAAALGVKIVSSEALHPVTAATTLRLRGGKSLTSDGPFAETKEQLGGYYLIDCPNVDAALAFAAHIPGARDGSIEIRPVVDFSQMG
jgi:hypothetical protein